MRPINDKHRIAWAKLAHILGSTAAPVLFSPRFQAGYLRVICIVETPELWKTGHKRLQFLMGHPFNLLLWRHIIGLSLFSLKIWFRRNVRKSEANAHAKRVSYGTEEIYGIISGDLREEQHTSKTRRPTAGTVHIIVFVCFFPLCRGWMQ